MTDRKNRCIGPILDGGYCVRVAFEDRNTVFPTLSCCCTRIYEFLAGTNLQLVESVDREKTCEN